MTFKDYSELVCDVVWSGRSFSRFQEISPPSGHISDSASLIYPIDKVAGEYEVSAHFYQNTRNHISAKN
jgi:hypothetical protein